MNNTSKIDWDMYDEINNSFGSLMRGEPDLLSKNEIENINKKLKEIKDNCEYIDLTLTIAANRYEREHKND